MPGLLGIVETTPSRHLEATFEGMLASMQRDGRLVNETCIAVDDQWALGRVHLGILQRAPQLVEGEPVQVLFHGDLFNEGELRKQLELETPLQTTDNIALLIKALYQTYGSEFPSRLKGSFCVVVLDATLKRLVLVNDYLGSYSLYWFGGPKRFVFAGELKAILRDPEATFRLNPAATADYLNFGFLFGNKTLASNVKLLPPSSTLTYCWEDGEWKLESYASIKEAF